MMFGKHGGASLCNAGGGESVLVGEEYESE
jgi:hypothetical protein